MEKYKIMLKGIVQYNDKYLVVEKWYDDRILEPYQWEFIDGKLEFGEAPDKGVIRVVEEGTGLTVQVSKPLYTWNYMVGDVAHVGICFLLLSSTDQVILSEELHDYKWLSKDEFKNYIHNQAILQDIEKAEL